MSDFQSTQLTNADATPPVLAATHDTHGRMRIARFDYTQVAQAAAGTVIGLVRLPAGKVRVFPLLSRLGTSALGTARTLDIGYEAYTDDNGDAVVADDNAFDDAIDVSSANDAAWGSDFAASGLDQTKLFESDTGVVISCTVLVDTIDAAETINGYVVYVVD